MIWIVTSTLFEPLASSPENLQTGHPAKAPRQLDERIPVSNPREL